VFQEIPYSHRINGNNLLWYIRSDMQEGKFPATRPADLQSDIELLWRLVSWCWVGEPASRPQARELSARLEGLVRPVHAMADTGRQLQFATDPVQNALQIGNMSAPDSGTQYVQATYATDAQPTRMINEFRMTEMLMHSDATIGDTGSSISALDGSHLEQGHASGSLLGPNSLGRMNSAGVGGSGDAGIKKKVRKKWTIEETKMLVDGCNKVG
jgi:hypothetical protein